MNEGKDSFLQYKNEITMIYGEAATGKTTLAKLATIEQAKQGKKVIYIDSEKGFSIDRFRQLAGPDYVSLLDHVIFFRPNNFSEQRKTIKELIPIIELGRIGMVIIDTIGIHYRAELKKDPEYVNRAMGEALKIFDWIASKNIPVLMINQVYSDFNNGVRNVGGNMLFDAAKNVILLEKDPRKLIIRKPEEKEIANSVNFRITETGIELIQNSH